MSAAFSLAQLRESLWTRQGARVHALIDGSVVPGLAEKLKGAELAGWDCLRRGALSAEAAGQAAYLAELKDASPFTGWLLEEATTTYPGWGILTVSTRPMLPMREHFRGLGEVITPGGDRRAWRWYDPEVLLTLLPTMLAAQLDEVFACEQAMVIPAPDAWTWLSLQDGVLSADRRPLMQAVR